MTGQKTQNLLSESRRSLWADTDCENISSLSLRQNGAKRQVDPNGFSRYRESLLGTWADGDAVNGSGTAEIVYILRLFYAFF